jgi:hypothetical protein
VQKASPTRSAALDRTSLWVLVVAAAIIGVAIAATTVAAVVSALASGTTTLLVSVDSPMPAELYPAGLPLESARFTEGVITTDALSWGPTLILLLGTILSGLSLLAVAAAAVHLGWSMLREEPFRRSVIRSTVAASIALILGSGLAAFLTIIGTAVAMSELIGDQFMSEQYPLLFSFDFAPIFVGVGIGIVAGAFEYGNRLHADTRGLV